MSDLSYTQEFLLCILKPQGTIPTFYSTQISTCLVAGGILELLNLNVISINDKKKIVVNNGTTLEKEYLRPLYQVICNSKKKDVKDIVSRYIFGTGKLLNEYIKSLSIPMVKENLISLETGGVFKTKTLYIPNEESVLRVVEKIRAEFLEGGPVSNETIILGALLYKSSAIKRYFSQYESDILKNRLNEVKKSKEGSFIKEMVDYIETLISVIGFIG